MFTSYNLPKTHDIEMFGTRVTFLFDRDQNTINNASIYNQMIYDYTFLLCFRNKTKRLTILVFTMLGRTQKLICVLQRSEYFLNKQFKNVKK